MQDHIEEPQDAIVRPATIRATATAHNSGVSTRDGDKRPWEEKWLNVLWLRDAIASAYDGTYRPGTVGARVLVTAFCNECHNLSEWLQGDPTVNVKSSVLALHVKQGALKIAGNVANSHKHHTRNQGTTTARVRTIKISPEGKVEVSVENDWANPNALQEDGLDLADRCVAAWRSFFASHGIAEP